MNTDQALISDKARRATLEILMLQLGKLQLARGMTNPALKCGWTAFEKWQRSG
jgi:hypothetical protein